MFVLIDWEKMVLLHKHHDFTALCDVAWIECRSTDCTVFGVEDGTGFRMFTDMELGLLYRNITGNDHTIKRRVALIQVLFDLVSRIPESDINPMEADRQAEHVKEGDTRKWVYVRGASRPAQKPDLYEHLCKHAEPNKDEEQRAIDGHTPALAPKLGPRIAPTGPDRAAPRAPVPPKDGNTLKRGTGKALIWEVADRMWEAAGKPTVKDEVLKLRKEIMDTLEKEEGVKRASASSELGNWHKDRAPY